MLTRDQAAGADDALERIIRAAGVQVTVDGVSIDAALAGHFCAVRERWPLVHALVIARLRETDNQELLLLAEEARCDD